MATQVLQTKILKPIYLVETLGENAVLPDGAVINIGGVSGPDFTVGGKQVVLVGDATASIDLQAVYESSIGEAFVSFTPNKDLVFQAVSGKQFRFDADTGAVTITGDLLVLGSTTTINNIQLETDRLTLHQSAGTYVPLIIEPLPGVVPASNIVEVKIATAGQPVFSINPAGVTYTKALTTGLVNGIDLTALSAAVSAHLNLTSPGIKHTGEQISVETAGLEPLTGSTVQEVIESIASTIFTLSTAEAVRAYEHIQLMPSMSWSIPHGQNTNKIQISVWDNTNELIFADAVSIPNNNTVTVSFNTLVTGRAVLMLF